MNKVILIGRLGKDVDLRYSPNGTAVATFSVATDEIRKGSNGEKEKHTEWHRVVIFGKLAEHCNEYLHKGSLICLEGRLRSRDYEDREGIKRYVTEIYADTVRFLDRKPESGPPESHSADDDLPF